MLCDPHAEIGLVEFMMFNVELPGGGDLIEYRKRPNTVAKREAMSLTGSELRKARVEQLAALYASRSESETSPFEDESADLEKFLESHNG